MPFPYFKCATNPRESRSSSSDLGLSEIIYLAINMGRTLFTFDRMNVIPKSSLYKDMKDAFNNIEREDEQEDDDNE